jgi:hypothetical protein
MYNVHGICVHVATAVVCMMQDDHNDLDTTILNDRHIYDVVV